jgi:phosphate transport system substrate-binding protein
MEGMKKSTLTILYYLWVVIREVGYAIGSYVLWGYGGVIIVFTMHYPGVMVLAWTALWALLYGAHIFNLFGKKRVRKGLLLLSLAAVAVLIAMPMYRWYTVDRHRQLSDQIQWWRYDPFRVGTLAKLVVADPQYHLRGDLPRIDGAYALYPLYAGAVQSLCEPNAEIEVRTNGSDRTFERLLAGKVDLIFSAPPSQLQEKAAQEAGLTFEMTPIAREAFVFFVHRENPVDNLSQEDIRAIYSGKVKHWEEINPAWSGEIKPFQRNEGSGSQTRLQRIMGDIPILPPIREDRVGGMGGIINDVAAYRNHREAIGFSFRYFTEEMFKNGDIKLLSIDGVAPTVENIRNGTYPFLSDFGIITVRPRSENTRKLVDFFFSEAGQTLIEETGYVPLPHKE